MTDQNAPPEIYLDARVARSIPSEPDEQGTPLVRYFSADRVKELVSMARGGPEFFVQLHQDPGGFMLGLTNYGRIFHQSSGMDWVEIKGPDLGADHAQMES